MKKILMILAIVFLIVILGVWWYGKNNKTAENKGSNYQAEKSIATNNINTNNTVINNKTNTNITQNLIDTKDNQNEIPNNDIQNQTKPKTETQIAVFTTKIYGNEAPRQNNMQITCNTLNNVEIRPGEIFSFCNTVGKATTEKGYQEADIFVDGEKKKGLGGGNCQISTTIYNAVAQVPELEVIERHQHSRDVKYIEKGKDAAVAYGSYDFKFKNNTDGIIRIIMEKTEKTITAKLIKIV